MGAIFLRVWGCTFAATTSHRKSELDSHDIVIAEGLPDESYLDYGAP